MAHSAHRNRADFFDLARVVRLDDGFQYAGGQQQRGACRLQRGLRKQPHNPALFGVRNGRRDNNLAVSRRAGERKRQQEREADARSGRPAVRRDSGAVPCAQLAFIETLLRRSASLGFRLSANLFLRNRGVLSFYRTVQRLRCAFKGSAQESVYDDKRGNKLRSQRRAQRSLSFRCENGSARRGACNAHLPRHTRDIYARYACEQEERSLRAHIRKVPFRRQDA